MMNSYLTILTKHDLFSYLGLVEGEVVEEDSDPATVTVVVKLDPREGEPIVKQFPQRNSAIRAYEEAIAKSIERGWEVIYRGAPLSG